MSDHEHGLLILAPNFDQLVLNDAPGQRIQRAEQQLRDALEEVESLKRRLELENQYRGITALAKWMYG